MRSVGWLIDNAMEAVERENARLKNVLNKDFARVQLDSSKLAGLISHFSDTDFSAKEYKGQPLDLKSRTSSATSTNTSSASSPWPKARRAASTTLQRASSP